MERIRVADDGGSFVIAKSKRPFIPWGFNYDHDARGRLLEDYWEAEWGKVAADFAAMKKLGANVVRIHLQTGRFLPKPESPDRANLARLEKLLALAERHRLYIDLTGLGCYHKADTPTWYDALDEPGRWQAQAQFWQAVARCCRDSPAVFCYDLMNEPVVPGGKRNEKDWLGPPFAGKHFVQFVTLDSRDRARPEIARQWIDALAAAVRKEDPHRLVTVGLVDWSLDRPGLTSGFVPAKIADRLDFLCVHLYPEKVEPALETLALFAAAGKPVVIEETFPLRCSPDDFRIFLKRSRPQAKGWIGFYWGQTPDELRPSTKIGDALTLRWLEIFQNDPPASWPLGK